MLVNHGNDDAGGGGGGSCGDDNDGNDGHHGGDDDADACGKWYAFACCKDITTAVNCHCCYDC